MKVKKTVKQEVWGLKMKHGGEVSIIGEASMRRTITNTLLGKLDTEEDDPSSMARPKAKRPWGDVVAMRQLLATGHVETLSADYDLIEA